MKEVQLKTFNNAWFNPGNPVKRVVWYFVNLFFFKNQPPIHFLNFQNQCSMPAVYNMCDVFILPSQSETWGLAMNEAMACGKAIVASDRCGGAIDLIQPGVNGFIFKINNLEDLKDKLQLFMNNEIQFIPWEFNLNKSSKTALWKLFVNESNRL